MKLVEIDISSDSQVRVGPKFMKDDFEHVTFDRNSHKIYASGFDGNIYMMDYADLKPHKIIWRAPFKLRWMKILDNSNKYMVAYCFNGGSI